jgi:hypothetical protein
MKESNSDQPVQSLASAFGEAFVNIALVLFYVGGGALAMGFVSGLLWSVFKHGFDLGVTLL